MSFPRLFKLGLPQDDDNAVITTSLEVHYFNSFPSLQKTGECIYLAVSCTGCHRSLGNRQRRPPEMHFLAQRLSRPLLRNATLSTDQACGSLCLSGSSTLCGWIVACATRPGHCVSSNTKQKNKSSSKYSGDVGPFIVCKSAVRKK